MLPPAIKGDTVSNQKTATRFDFAQTGRRAVPIPGVKKARQAEDDVGVMNWSLTEAEVAALDAIASAEQPAEPGIAI